MERSPFSGPRQICALCTIALSDAVADEMDPFIARRKQNLVKDLMKEAKKIFNFAVQHKNVAVLTNMANPTMLDNTNIAEKIELVEKELSDAGRSLYKSRVTLHKRPRYINNVSSSFYLSCKPNSNDCGPK